MRHTTTTADGGHGMGKRKSELWQRLRSARSFAEKTQGEIAKALGVSRPTVTLWESREAENRTNPTGQQIMAFARECKVPAQFLVDDEADPDDVFSYKPGPASGLTPLDGIAPKAGEAESRQARAFWSAVEFKVVSERPALAECFEVSVEAAHISVRVDFMHNRNVVEFTAPMQRSDSETLMESTAHLLLCEKALGRTLQKHVLIYTKTGTFNIDGKSAFERSFGVTLKAFADIDKAAEFVLSL